ncbi:MAG: sigma-70 family RNA polymerase sigma factor [Verrucomicrobiae bacterium]|nr:sigma-70 family RNA polymerase sigma factor [Verrucomicrobiae bacterium]
MAFDIHAAGSDANPMFATTHWSVVLLAGRDGTSPGAEQALLHLCQIYWYPVYAFFRRDRQSAEDSEDLTQTFFAALLKRNDLARVHPAKGRFRNFLLASARHFLMNELDRAKRLKRGGRVEVLSIDGLAAERWYQLEPVDESSPDKAFDRRWAETLIEVALDRLKADCEAASQGFRFEVLRDFVLGDPSGVTYAEAATRLGLSESAVTSAIHRMRLRFREHLLREAAQTLDDARDAESELRDLIEALSQ